MKIAVSLLAFCSFLPAFSQMSRNEILEHRQEHAQELNDTASGVLNQEEIDHFEGLDYFDFDAEYQVTATFTKDKGKKFKMPTSTDRLPVYRRYGYIDFTIDTTQCRLTVYQNVKLSKNKAFKDYLFIPFRDKTTRVTTYGAGRYLDIEIPEGNTVLIDFNLAYNPYCAYSYRYSCPIPPEENTLEVEINAGEKIPLAH